ncbi:MAG: Cyanophycin synthetase [Pseudomonadota bacterium]|jgi:cyanophycin synthetase
MTFPDIAVLRMRYLRGPNVWTYRPVIEAWVDLGTLEDHPSNTLPGFVERLTTWLPGMIEHRCGVGERGGFFERLQSGTWCGHIMEHVAIELQTLAGMQVGFGKARETSQRGVYKVVIRTRQEEVGRASFMAARDLVMAAINNTAFDVKGTVSRLKAMVDRLCLGPSTACIVDAATEHKIPSIRLTSGNLVQLGYGAKQRRIWTAETDRTSAIAESISSDKDLTKMLLTQCGVPIPTGEVVDSPEQAWEVAQDLGLPVAVKPTDANHGRGVALDLRSREDIEAAFTVAQREGTEVMVERFIPGEEHRLLVVGNRVVAASRGETAKITGDGVHTVEELIELQINSDPRRGEEEDFPLDTIRLKDLPTAVLELQRQGLSATSVPAKDRVCIVQRTGNMGIDVTDEVHPDVAAVVVLAARVIGLDIAGIDLVAQDISKPLLAQGGAIVEVNAGPGLLMHLKPAIGQPRPVGEAIVAHLFNPQEPTRIPVVGIMGRSQTAELAHLVNWLIHLSGRRTGLASSRGLFMDQRLVDPKDARVFEASQRLLINRALDAAVFENSPLQVLEEGLPYDRCHVGVLTDMPDATGLQDHDVQTPEQVRNVVRTQIDLVLPEGAAVLNAEDAAVVDLADLCDGEVIYYAPDASNSVIGQHLSNQGRAVFTHHGEVILARGTTQTVLLQLDFPPIAKLLKNGGLSLSHVLAAVAVAWALDMSPELIRAGLKNYGQPAPEVARKKA